MRPQRVPLLRKDIELEGSWEDVCVAMSVNML